MADSKKFEEMLECLVNEDKAKAEEIFHNIVVEKSREIYEDLLEADLKDDEVDEATDDDKEVDEASKDDDKEVDEASKEDDKEPADTWNLKKLPKENDKLMELRNNKQR